VNSNISRASRVGLLAGITLGPLFLFVHSEIFHDVILILGSLLLGYNVMFLVRKNRKLKKTNNHREKT
jgi:hypothetical protein